MKAILVLFDTLNRHYLPPYGDQATLAPNFQRLARRALTFDRCYAGSLPCMPARRDLMTGRLSFLHSAWGPLEPFEDSLPRALGRRGVYTRLITDHYHYWEDGGSGYHTQFTTWEGIRGQEGDPWQGRVTLPDVSRLPGRRDRFRAQDLVNREAFQTASDYPLAQVFEKGLDFLEANQKEDQWFLQLESFTPHEPFVCAPQFQAAYPYDFSRPGLDWPAYELCRQAPDEIEHTQMCYRACLTACDHYLGQLMDTMDRLDLWRDTVLIVTTDHGYLLGEHGWWGKSVQPCYEEIAHIPFFLWHPGLGRGGERCDCLTQLIDVAPTLLEAFGAPPLAGCRGLSLKEVCQGALPPRPGALFGYFGCQVNVTDGRYAYLRAPEGPGPVYEYTLAPYHMKGPMALDTLRQAQWQAGSPWSFGSPLMKLPGSAWSGMDCAQYPTQLFDLFQDPRQASPLADPAAEAALTALMARLMAQAQAPLEQFDRLGLPRP